jgi:hypothetical protein
MLNFLPLFVQLLDYYLIMQPTRMTGWTSLLIGEDENGEEIVIDTGADGRFVTVDGRLTARYWTSDNLFFGIEGGGSFPISGGDDSDRTGSQIDLKNSYFGLASVGIPLFEDGLVFYQGGFQQSAFEVDGRSIDISNKIAHGIGIEVETDWFGGGRLRFDVIRQRLDRDEAQIGLDGSLLKVGLTYGKGF